MDQPSENLPRGFMPISVVSEQRNQLVNVVGVVTEYLSPKLSRGTDYTISFTICDSMPFETSSGLFVRVFKGSLKELPQINNIGDVITNFNGKSMGMTTYNTKWTVGSVSQFTTYKLNFAPSSSKLVVSPKELEAIHNFHRFYTTQVDENIRKAAQTAVKQTASRGRKFACIKDMEFDCFYDTMGEVVKVFPGQSNFTIYLTDYTSNPLLHCYGWDESSGGGGQRYGGNADGEDYTGTGGGRGGSNWVGPCGQYTLQITLWDIHAVTARRHVKEGCYIRLKNVRAKRNRDGKLEGALHGDRQFPERVDIEVVTDLGESGVKQIKQKKIEVQRRAEDERVAYQAKLDAEKRVEDTKIEAEKRFHESLNPHVKKLERDIPVIPLGSIVNVQYPKGTIFTNTTYRTVCRVIDYIPHDLKNFCVLKEQKARRKSVGKKRHFSEDEDSDEEDTEDSESEVWEWRFALLVEGQDGETLKLMMNNESAEFLLNMDASNLSENPGDLDRVRKLLSYLWGDLEERKIRKLQQLKNNQNKADGKDNRKRKNRRQQVENKRRKSEQASGSNTTSSAADNDDSEEDDDNRYGESTAEFFDAYVQEYGVSKVVNGQEKCIRSFMLSGVSIKPKDL
ncbi:hypothetical protein DFH27DRAFT_605009 [Peziza echinospora]|nr:hypothetical protein DFH27DRAFT_605009 [Peziza echinospora]